MRRLYNQDGNLIRRTYGFKSDVMVEMDEPQNAQSGTTYSGEYNPPYGDSSNDDPVGREKKVR